jgi:hypothetical protein
MESISLPNANSHQDKAHNAYHGGAGHYQNFENKKQQSYKDQCQDDGPRHSVKFILFDARRQTSAGKFCTEWLEHFKFTVFYSTFAFVMHNQRKLLSSNGIVITNLYQRLYHVVEGVMVVVVKYQFILVNLYFFGLVSLFCAFFKHINLVFAGDNNSCFL